jgi:lipopolysaccharide export system protein LptC
VPANPHCPGQVALRGDVGKMALLSVGKMTLLHVGKMTLSVVGQTALPPIRRSAPRTTGTPPQHPRFGHRARLLLAIGSAAALLGALLFATQSGSITPTRDLPEALIGEPDLYMRDAVITQFEDTGRMKYQLASLQIRHFEDDQLTRLAAPDLSLYNPPQPPWRVTSDHGCIRQAKEQQPSGEVVFLRENVELHQQYPDGRHLRMRSPALYLYPDRQYAETDQAVMIDTDVGRTRAVGLKGDLQRGLLNLFSSGDQRVHTIILQGQFK